MDPYITLGEVVPFLSKVLGIERTRQTVHNWAVKGIRFGRDRVFLKTERRAGIRYTTRTWVREFVDAVSD
jgi:hypothetical protein